MDALFKKIIEKTELKNWTLFLFIFAICYIFWLHSIEGKWFAVPKTEYHNTTLFLLEVFLSSLTITRIIVAIKFLEAKVFSFCTGKFSGTTEIDECYVGGSDSNKHTNKKFKSHKATIISLVNRETKQVKAFMVENADKECLLPKIGWNVEEKSVIVTDSYHTYNDLSNNYKHKSVKHSANEYVRTKLIVMEGLNMLN